MFIFGILQNLNIKFQEKFGSFSNLSIFSFNMKNIARDYPEIKTSQSSEFTSGRRTDWKNILEFNERKILGNGVLGDRFLINQSASNLLFYTYASSGIIGVLIIVSISILVLLQVFKIFFNKKNKYEPYKFSSCIILLALMMRSILETSYGVFGIDFIIFCICFSLIIPQKKIYGSN